MFDPSEEVCTRRRKRRGKKITNTSVIEDNLRIVLHVLYTHEHQENFSFALILIAAILHLKKA